MPGVRRPAECPACAVEAKRRRLLVGDAPPPSREDVDSDDNEGVMDEAGQEEDTKEENCSASGACEHICKRCMECKRVLATSHLLDLHIREAHDAMFSILAEKQPMYECFDESCKEIYESGDERLAHGVTQHGYPTKFQITKKQYPPREAKQEKQKKKKTANPVKSTETMAVEKSTVEDSERLTGAEGGEVDNTAVSKGKIVYSYKVPSDVCFGKGTQKGFHRPKHWHQHNKPKQDTKTNIENIDMTDLADTWKLDT